MNDNNNRRSFLKKLGAGAGLSAMPAGLFAGMQYTPGQAKANRASSYLIADRRNEGGHSFNGQYTGSYLNHIAFPIGGIGAGMFCMEGTGAISHLSVNNRPEMYNEPYAFAAVSVKGVSNGAKVLEAPVPGWKLFGPAGSGNGSGNRSYGLPRFESGNFLPRFPFATLELGDNDIPLQVKVVGWSPFIPGDEDNSSLPGGVMEYHFKNNSGKKVEAVFSYNARNFIDENGQILEEKNGFRVTKANSKKESGFSIFVDQDNAVVDYCWFRGGWFDPQTILWKQIRNGELVSNPPVEGSAPGASIFVPISVLPGEEKVISVNFNWYLPNSKLSAGALLNAGPAFRESPSRGTAPNQMEVSGFAGKRLVNTFDPKGDGQTGILQSPVLKISKRYLKFLIGGGSNPETTAVKLIVDDKVVEVATGLQSERLLEKTWDLEAFAGKEATIQIVDQDTYPWGHILADQFVLTDNPNENLSNLSDDAILVADFENDNYNGWKKIQDSQESPELEETEPFYKPWYTSRFKSLDEFIVYWKTHIKDLKKKSELFRDAFYNTTLPVEVVEAVAANLTILKSPTVLRQYDGRLWGWEGCSDNAGCCHGSCTHVWNYAQTIPHLFPNLERTFRETEFEVNQNEEGHQVFRSNLPITTTIHNFHSAADGQLGGIMKIYRDWRISGDSSWLKKLYPKVKQSLDYCIETWDPKHQGFLEEPHHNTYDIEFWGPDGMCTSFYIGALTAFIEMSKALEKPCERYETLVASGKNYMETELFDGEYFIQKIKWTGLVAPNPVEAQSFNTKYSAEALEILKKEGPKYQYGKGCLSDGILGMWMASVCGLKEALDNEKVTSHLNSIHKYNLKDTLIDHDNPQRPTYACGEDGGLLLCTWPKGGKLSLPFVYSNEVWTGIEYQVASHLMFKGEVQKGLDVVRECRLRYDGFIRNPFDEYECGHWYARAMSSYGMLEGLTGVRYDAVDRALHIDSKIGDFTSFISTQTGFGNVGLKGGQPFVKCYFGEIDIQKVLVSGVEKKFLKS
ncbi:GH116 family glycosyl hydrolase [Sunxiuqinia sp. A32]|uniref:GH116 family glycosyl hydrolase n=1 Tax=Sunxiuqinia sp. A32 TaxID=3461496 RepID=UPI004046020C